MSLLRKYDFELAHLSTASVWRRFRLPLLLRLAVSLTFIFLLPLLVIVVWPTDNGNLQAFLQMSPDCSGPCFMGIRPGVTLGAEAFAVLENHEWVTNIQLETYTVSPTYGKVTWDWTAAAPEFVDHTQPGALNLMRQGIANDFASTLVESIAIPTTARLHLAEQVLGEPDARSVGIRAGGLTYGVAYAGDSAKTILATELPCPANMLTYWEGRATLYLTIWTGPDHYVQPQTVVGMC